MTDLLTQGGAVVADIGCAGGMSILLLAEAFPKSTFVGFEFQASLVESATKQAAEAGLTNASFEAVDACKLCTWRSSWTRHGAHKPAH